MGLNTFLIGIVLLFVNKIYAHHGLNHMVCQY